MDLPAVWISIPVSETVCLLEGGVNDARGDEDSGKTDDEGRRVGGKGIGDNTVTTGGRQKTIGSNFT
jgi:hypothetical protein